MKLATQEVECQVRSVACVIDTSSLAPVGVAAAEVAKNEVATLTLDIKKPIAFDCFTDVVETGRFVIVDGHDVAGGGIIPEQGDLSESYEI